MQTRIHAQEIALGAVGGTSPPMSASERLNCGWAGVDDHQAILDLACENTALLSYFLDRYRIRGCGLSNDPVRARELREALPEAEIAYAGYDDIPWMDETFDVVLISRRLEGTHSVERMALEILRVLRSGGKLVLTFRSLPFLHSGRNYFSLRASAWTPDSRTLPRLLSDMGFGEISWRRPGGIYTTLIATKPDALSAAGD